MRLHYFVPSSAILPRGWYQVYASSTILREPLYYLSTSNAILRQDGTICAQVVQLGNYSALASRKILFLERIYNFRWIIDFTSQFLWMNEGKTKKVSVFWLTEQKNSYLCSRTTVPVQCSFSNGEQTFTFFTNFGTIECKVIIVKKILLTKSLLIWHTDMKSRRP